MKKFHCLSMIFVIFLFVIEFAQAMTRTLKNEPAIVIAAFGTTTKAQSTYDFFEEQLRKELPPDYRKLRIEWAFTSEIVRERANKTFKEKGSEKRYLSLMQVLANLEDQGYRTFAIQPLHIFPGQEYSELENIVEGFRHMGLKVAYGSALFDKWEDIHEVIGELEKDFLPPDQGCNIVVVHGSPQTSHDANSIYLGLDRYVVDKYPNVFVGAVDGVLTRQQALTRARECKPKRVKFFPLMYVAGDHIMNDIMGKENNQESELSWAMEMEQASFTVETVYTTYQGKEFFKGLGFYPAINHKFISNLVRTLKSLDYAAKPVSH